MVMTKLLGPKPQVTLSQHPYNHSIDLVHYTYQPLLILGNTLIFPRISYYLLSIPYEHQFRLDKLN